MKQYDFSTMYIGLTESFKVMITDEMMNIFRQLSGDVNPLHNDSEYAKKSGYKDRVVYGMLTASLISTLGGVYLPGKNCIIRSVKSNFASPVYINDELTIYGTVIGIYEDRGYVDIRVEVINQNGEKVLRGKLEAGVRDER